MEGCIDRDRKSAINVSSGSEATQRANDLRNFVRVSK
jgi:hypothetical protein